MNTTTCPNCQAVVPAAAAFCDQCGAPLSGEGIPVISLREVCPNCQSPVGPEDVFCDQCGAALPTASGFPQSPQIPADAPGAPPPAAPAGPRLAIQPNGAVVSLALDQDSYVIGREDPASGSYPDIDLVPFGGEEGGVSRRHAQITRRDGEYFIEDLNSVNYTFVNKRKIAVGVAHPLRDGDEIRLGRVLMRFQAQ
jgi:hypothetical protein